jgi:hypothetical protein
MNISCRIANADTQCGRITNPPERASHFLCIFQIFKELMFTLLATYKIRTDNIYIL